MRKRLPPLSREEQEKRRPLPPEMLVDALQDRVHVEKGKLLSSRPIMLNKPKPTVDYVRLAESPGDFYNVSVEPMIALYELPDLEIAECCTWCKYAQFNKLSKDAQEFLRSHGKRKNGWCNKYQRAIHRLTTCKHFEKGNIKTVGAARTAVKRYKKSVKQLINTTTTVANENQKKNS